MTEPNVDEPVHLEPYHPAWLELYAAEVQRMRQVCGMTALTIEHIGSTAVPELVAKPIIDIMIGVASYPPSPELASCLSALGYEGMGEAGVPGRLYFRLRQHRCVNVHIVAMDSMHWRTNLAIRDYLRLNPAAREAYSQAKVRALNHAGCSLIAYSVGKSEFMRELMQVALQATSMGTSEP